MSEFCNEWFSHPEWWFDAQHQYDDLITQRFGHLLDQTHERYDPLTQILIHDQLPRHVYRKEQSAHMITYHLQKALAISLRLIKQDVEAFNAEYWCFILLPLRHVQTFDLCQRSIKKAWKLLAHFQYDPNSQHVIKRFLKASYQHTPIVDVNVSTPGDYWQLIVPQHIQTCHAFDASKFKDILKHIPAKGCIPEHDLDRTHTLTQACAKQLEMCDHPLIVSVSGGVDSMVCLTVFSQLAKEKGVPVTAVHINYKNKETCNQDEAFVIAWCTYLGVPLVIRRIWEIQREPCMEHDMRDVYETYTRNVRYMTYKSVSPSHVSYVVLGHNRDDCFENIMTNITYGQKYDNLMGMAQLSQTDGIHFVRPLLEIPKASICQFAVESCIPHLQDSTPSWSQRGKIRDKIVPCLEEWDYRCIPWFFELSNVMTELYAMMDAHVMHWVSKTVQDGTKKTLALSMDDITTSSLHWRSYIQQLTQRTPSCKSLATLQERIGRWKQMQPLCKDTNRMHVVLMKGVTITLLANKDRTVLLCIELH